MTSPSEQPVLITASGGVVLHGDLAVSRRARGLVVFAHGSGSGRHSPRNRTVAASLRARGLGTLLVDLLTAEEEQEDLHTAHLRFDIGLLADRLAGCASWVGDQPSTAGLPIGYFGASTGAAAAIVAAARHPAAIAAVVSRGGRPDLAGEHLSKVRAPTLLIVGSLDTAVIGLNQAAYDQLGIERGLEIVPGAAHLFEEPGALEEVARLAGDWFARHFSATRG